MQESLAVKEKYINKVFRYYLVVELMPESQNRKKIVQLIAKPAHEHNQAELILLILTESLLMGNNLIVYLQSKH